MVLLRVFTLEVLPALPVVDCCASTLPAFCGSGTCWALGVDDAPSCDKPGRQANPTVSITRLTASRCFLEFNISARFPDRRTLTGSVLVQQKGA